jgi:crotonobetainyl-CoA:carnitine CoA-transferase CaiB-like acyl-CoA transferase
MFTEIDHPVAGRFETLAAPFTLSTSDLGVRGPAPDVGEHTGEVLRRFGVDDERIASLAAAGVVGGNA